MTDMTIMTLDTKWNWSRDSSEL